MLVRTLGLLALLGTTANTVSFDPNSESSIKSAAKTVASNMWTYYTGYRPGDNPGNLPKPYFWWEMGCMLNHAIDYWYYTGDTTWNWMIRQAITWQSGEDGRFEPANQTFDSGNDDVIFWALAAMSAAEFNFDPPQQNESVPDYLAMAQSVLYRQNERWDTTKCKGGLRWQIQPVKAGYTYKNSVSNGGFFQLAARLARYTGNNTYLETATRSWDWFSNSVLYEPDKGVVNDGAQMEVDCKEANAAQWSYNYGLWLTGLAFLYNYTGDAKWLPPLKTMLNTFLSYFFHENNVLQEVRCEPVHNCNTDNLVFKSLNMRYLILIMQMVPELKNQIDPYYLASAKGAAGQCSGPGNLCGYSWLSTTWDNSQGLGQEMSALAAIQGSMYQVKDLKLPYTGANGGQAKGDPNAGVSTNKADPLSSIYTREITGGDKAGAGILTTLALVGTLGGTYWLLAFGTS